MTLKDGTVITFPKAAQAPAAQASAAAEQAPPRKGADSGAPAAPEKSAENKVDVDPLLSPELRAQLEADRVSQLMIDDPVAYEQYMMDSTIERERQLGQSSTSSAEE